MVEELYLYETLPLRAFFKRLRCLLKGGHKHIYTDCTLLEDGSRSLHYECAHCRHFQIAIIRWEEVDA